MKIDPTVLQQLAAQSDEELWHSIVSMAASKGFRLPKETPKAEEMEKIRALLLHPERVNLPQMLRLLKQYKKGE